MQMLMNGDSNRCIDDDFRATAEIYINETKMYGIFQLEIITGHSNGSKSPFSPKTEYVSNVGCDIRFKCVLFWISMNSNLWNENDCSIWTFSE